VSVSEHPKEIAALIKRLKAEYPPGLGADDALSCAATTPSPVDPSEPLLGEFLRSFLIWESTTIKAAAAMKRIEEAVVDFNELRICFADELSRVMGERYPRVEERALRLRAALNEIYHREHSVTLEPLMALGKREAKEYLDSLDGVPRFVSARVCLLRLGAHTAPVDGRICKRLIEAEITEPGATPDAAAGSLERKVHAGGMGEVYRLLQTWADDAPLNYSETPVELPKRRPLRDVPSPNHNHDLQRKRMAAAKAAGREARRKPAG